MAAIKKKKKKSKNGSPRVTPEEEVFADIGQGSAPCGGDLNKGREKVT